MCVTANQAIFNGLKNTYEKKGREIERKEEVKKKKKKDRKTKEREKDKH